MALMRWPSAHHNVLDTWQCGILAAESSIPPLRGKDSNPEMDYQIAASQKPNRCGRQVDTAAQLSTKYVDAYEMSTAMLHVLPRQETVDHCTHA